MATTRDSVFFAAIQTNKYLSDKRQSGDEARTVPFEIEFVATLATGDIYNLFTIPANARVTAFEACVTVGNTASSVMIVGDAGNTARLAASGAMVLTTDRLRLAAAGQGWTPTADTVVFATHSGSTPTLGAKVVGYVQYIPG